MATIQNVTVRDFSREVLASNVPVVLDVYADWCGPCRALAPLLEQAAGVYADRIKFLKVDVDEESEIATLYPVDGVPTLLFFRDGQLTDRVVGLSDPRALAAKFDRLVANGVAA